MDFLTSPMSHDTDRVRYVLPPVPGYTSVVKKVTSTKAFADSETAQYRLKVVEYYQRFGLMATLAAFPVKRSTVFLWQKTLQKNHGRLSSLIPISSRPHTVRSMTTHPLVLAEICQLRKDHYRLGKKKLYYLVKRYCERVGIAYPRVSTIGKIIQRNHIFFDKPTYGYHDPGRKKYSRRKKERVIYAPKPEQGGYVQLDTIETIVGTVRRYTVTAIDVKLKVAYAQTFKSPTAANALMVLTSLKRYYQYLFTRYKLIMVVSLWEYLTRTVSPINSNMSSPIQSIRKLMELSNALIVPFKKSG